MRRLARALAPVARLAVRVTLACAVAVAGAAVVTVRLAGAAESFRFVEPAMQVAEGQAIVRVVVERTDLPVSRVTVDYRLESGTATEREDFAGGAGRLVFDVGERQATVIAYVRDDDLAEEREHFLVQLLGPSSASATISIIDDDGTAPATATPAASTAPPAPADAPPSAGPAAVTAAPPRTETVRRRVAATRSAAPAPRRVTVRQSPVTPFELRPAPGTSATSMPSAVDPAIALLAGLLLAKVSAEVWFRARTVAS